MTVFNPSTGIESINLDITRDQTLTTGTTGTDFAIVDNGTGDHKFNLPNASATARGVLSTGSQTIAGTKTLSSSTTFFGAPNSSVELRATIAGASSTGAGTSIYIEAADGGATSGDGGDFNHQAGNAVGGNSNGGNHNYITGVKNGSGANGKHNFSEGTGNPVMTLNLSGLSTNRTLSAPDKSGIIAVTSDITATGTVTSVGLSSTNSTLTIGSTPITTSGTITADINLSHANTWTGAQVFQTSGVGSVPFRTNDHSGSYIATSQDTGRKLQVYNGLVENSLNLFYGSASLFTVTDSSKNLVSFSALAGASNGGITYTPTIGNGGFVINAPTSFAGPVINIKSNGSQTAYISDLGNLYAQQGAFNAGVATDAFGSYTGGNVTLSNTIVPNNNNSLDLGDGTHLMRTVYSNLFSGGDFTGGTINGSGLTVTSFTMATGAATGYVLTSDINGVGTWQAPGNPFDQSLNTSDSVSFSAVNATNFVASSDVSANTLTVQTAISNSNALLSFSTQAGGTLSFGGTTADYVQFIAGDAGGTPGNPVTPAGYITAKNSTGAIIYWAYYQ